MKTRKTLAIVALMVCSCAFVNAQQALFGNSKVVSPQINADNTVTFRLSAPKAVRVQVVGDFLAPQKLHTEFGEVEVPAAAEMTEKDVLFHQRAVALVYPVYGNLNLIVVLVQIAGCMG